MLRCFNFEVCSILLPHDKVENLLEVMCDMNNDVVIYQSADGLVKMEAIVDASNETIWATQKAMASLLGVDRTVITRHLSNIFKEGELHKEVVCAKIAQTTPHGAMEGEFPMINGNLSKYLPVCPKYVNFCRTGAQYHTYYTVFGTGAPKVRRNMSHR